MDNITHAFAGAALAELALPRTAPAVTRRAFVTAGVLAASAPDIDLIYTGITAAPLGYLLHHRGHTHTLPGVLALAVAMIVVMHVWPAARAAVAGASTRLAVAVTAAVLSHLLMDAANSYGTHLLYPMSSRWVYGDAVFVLEPWLWLCLGVAMALNATRWGWRTVAWAMTVAPLVAIAYARLIAPWLVVALAVAGTVAAIALRRQSTRARAGLSLVAALTIFAVFFSAAHAANAAVRRAVASSEHRQVLDVVLNPNPGTPWCWSAIVVEEDVQRGELVARRGTLSLAPSVWPATACASHRLLGPGVVPSEAQSAALVWNRQWRTGLAELRTLYASDCRARAWLQFGRVPYVSQGRIRDLRFENPIGQNFSAMDLTAEGGACPGRLTNWLPPRLDALVP